MKRSDRPVRSRSARHLFLALAVGALAPGPACSEDRRPAPVWSESILEGAALYEAHGCVACHGREGAGDGPLASSMRPRPRDLRRAGDFTGPREVDAIADLISRGIRSGGATMPAYRHLDSETRRKLAAYVLSIAGGPAAASPGGTR